VVVEEVPAVREWTIPLPWTSPPLTLNARKVKAVRMIGWVEARRWRIPELARCEVQLVYAPRDSRVRDEDNLVATLKPLCDGLVDAGVVPDDGPAFMAKPTPRIAAPQRPPALWLVVTELPALTVEELVERGSLGSRSAREARASVSPTDAARVVSRARQISRDECPWSGGCACPVDGWCAG